MDKLEKSRLQAQQGEYRLADDMIADMRSNFHQLQDYDNKII